MPPNRRKKLKKHRPNDANDVVDDDVFEVDDKPIKKRYKASSTTRQNLRSSDKPLATSATDKKHVGMKRKSLVAPEVKSKPVFSDSDQSDIEMDIGPPSQKHDARPKGDEAEEPNAKRQKVCDESSSEKDDASEKTAPSVADEPPPAKEKDSNAKTIGDNAANSERITDNDSEDLDYELAIEDTDLLLDLDANEASASGTTQSVEVTTTEKTRETEPIAENENENEKEAQSEPEMQPEAADIENAAIDKELNEEYEDDVLDLDGDLDLFKDVDDVTKSPLVQKKKNLMNIPKWKQAEMEKGKGTEPKPVESKQPGPENANRPTSVNRVPITTVTSTTAPVIGPKATAAAAAATVPKPGTVFKIPLQVHQTANRDPRLVKTITNTNTAAPNTAQATQQSNQNASSANADTGERKSVKDRLGTKFQSQGLFSNIRNTTSFVIQSQMRLTAAESSSVASRVEQPIPSIPMSMIRTSSETVNRQEDMRPQPQPMPVVYPTPPAFARKSKGQAEIELIMPSFATGAQKYEPVFTYLFKTTCRYYMRDSCVKPNCELEHRMPDHSFFREAIEKMFQDSVIDLYENYMCRNQKLFDFYFDDFCYYFGKRKLLDNLKQMAEDCAERRVAFQFNSIIDGLMLTGLSYAKAVATLIPSIRCRSVKTSKEVLKLILNPRIGNIDPFVQVIESIRQNVNFKFTNEWINRLLIIHSQKKNTNTILNHTIFELINGVSLEKSARALDQELLAKFIDAFTKSQQAINES